VGEKDGEGAPPLCGYFAGKSFKGFNLEGSEVVPEFTAVITSFCHVAIILHTDDRDVDISWDFIALNVLWGNTLH
jgi:hypothetical protein